MPAAIDITGQRFGNLVAVSLAENTTPRRWLFACDCGTSKVLNHATVRYGKTQSCGCFRKKTTAKNRFINRVGERHGRILVVECLPDKNKHRHTQWKCLCDCGNYTVTTTPGKTKSCGCLQRESIQALGKSFKQENPVSRTPEYRKINRAKRRERPEQAMAERVSRLLCWALASVGAIKRSATFDLLGYTPAQLVAHIESQFLPDMTWDNRREWHIDHVRPISLAKSESDVIALNQLNNLRPLWAKDNMSKGNRLR